MTVQMERPLITEAESPEEWAAEAQQINAYRGSIDFLLEIEQALTALHRKEWMKAKLEQRKRAEDDAAQESRRDIIRAENEAEAEAVHAQTCPSCFCVHAGGC